MLILLLAACGKGDGAGGVEPSRAALPGGGTIVHYPTLPSTDGELLDFSLSIGVFDGDHNETFGDIRGVEVDRDGNIYVLDHQASEIRAFDADGGYLLTLTRKGQGPGELMAANGMVLTDRGTLWVQDHGQWAMIELTLQGDELQRHPMHVRSYGYLWNGTVDNRGRFWRLTNHSDDAPTYPPSTGVTESTFRNFVKRFDPATQESDSIFLGVITHKSFVAQNAEGGYSFWATPFAPQAAFIVDPRGGFWTMPGDAYRIARLDEVGDTALVIEVDVPASPVTADDKRAYIANLLDRGSADRALAEELAALAHPMKSVIDQLVLDDEGRLWVRRGLDEGETPVYDVFDREGHYLDTIRLDFRPVQYQPPRIRDGHLYAVVADDLGVQKVVRVSLPSL